MDHQAQSDMKRKIIIFYKTEGSEPPHPNPLPAGAREEARSKERVISDNYSPMRS